MFWSFFFVFFNNRSGPPLAIGKKPHRIEARRTGITHYRSGLSHEEDQLIPNLYRYVPRRGVELGGLKRPETAGDPFGLKRLI